MSIFPINADVTTDIELQEKAFKSLYVERTIIDDKHAIERTITVV